MGVSVFIGPLLAHIVRAIELNPFSCTNKALSHDRHVLSFLFSTEIMLESRLKTLVLTNPWLLDKTLWMSTRLHYKVEFIRFSCLNSLSNIQNQNQELIFHLEMKIGGLIVHKFKDRN